MAGDREIGRGNSFLSRIVTPSYGFFNGFQVDCLFLLITIHTIVLCSSGMTPIHAVPPAVTLAVQKRLLCHRCWSC